MLHTVEVNRQEANSTDGGARLPSFEIYSCFLFLSHRSAHMRAAWCWCDGGDVMVVGGRAGKLEVGGFW